MTTYKLKGEGKKMDPKLENRITKHGKELLALFPHAQIREPIALCKKLRRFETSLQRYAEQYCNVPDYDIDKCSETAMKKVRTLLGVGSKRVWFNRNPRGYALKVDLREGEKLYKDWGGYGIIAPDLRED